MNGERQAADFWREVRHILGYGGDPDVVRREALRLKIGLRRIRARRHPNEP